MVSIHHVGVKAKGRQVKRREQNNRESAVLRYIKLRQERKRFRQELFLKLFVLCLMTAVFVLYPGILACMDNAYCMQTYIRAPFTRVTDYCMQTSQNLLTMMACVILALPTAARDGCAMASASYASLVTEREPAALIRARRIASNGEPAERLAAQYTLGIMYQEGEGVMQNYEQAESWLRKAAYRGHARAQYNLGIMYENGEMAQISSSPLSSAVKYYRKAANQGHAAAQYSLGVMIKDGRGAVKNVTEALEWLHKAERQGDPMANAMITGILALQRKESKSGEQQEVPSEEDRNSEVRFPPIPVGTRVEIQSNERQQGTVQDSKDDGTFKTSVRIDGKTYSFDRNHLRILSRESPMEAPKEEHRQQRGLSAPSIRAFASVVATKLSAGVGALLVLIAACMLTILAPSSSGGRFHSALVAGFLQRTTRAAMHKEEITTMPQRKKAAGDPEVVPLR